MTSFIARIGALLAVAFLHGCTGQLSVPDNVARELAAISTAPDYTYDVKPILSDRCFACHGPDVNKVKGGLRLDLADAAYGPGEDGGMNAIVPGKPWKSGLAHRILSEDPDMVMPTPDSHLSLTDKEKAILIRWIEEGAVYKPHWSFTQIQKTRLPEVKNRSWIKNEIDHFILAGLEKHNLAPFPEADKTTLLRRVSMDLTGLPPTPEEVAAYLEDSSPDAYEKVVDRLINSPHYGEQMAVPWLDIARYADTHGYQDDMMRTAWPYRDWVIGAFNQNLPYDKFVTWQLAGDLLQNPTTDQMVATAFNRMHQQSMEGGIISEEYRTEYVADRVNTFGLTFMGLTTECARCHDHKYDPFSQKDYFSLYAFFNNINENGQIPYNGEASPSITLPTPEAKVKLDEINRHFAAEDTKRKKILSSDADFMKWTESASLKPEKGILASTDGLYGYFNFDEPKGRNLENLAKKGHQAYIEGDEAMSDSASRPGKFGLSRRVFGENAVDFGKDFAYFERNQPFTVSLWLNILNESVNGSIIHKSNHITSGYRGWNLFREKDGTFRLLLSYVWPDNCIELQTLQPVPINEWTQIAFSYNGLSKADGLKLYINGKEAPLKVVNDNLTQSILFGKNKTNIAVNNLKIGRLNDVFTKDFEVDELKIFTRNLTAVEMRSLFSQKNEVKAILEKSSADRNANDLADLREYFFENISGDYKMSMNESRKNIGEQTELLNTQIDVMVMKERKFPRKTNILARGVYDAPGAEVTADTPDELFKMPKDYPRNRLGLAKWLIHEKNPLFSRVAVNRFWQQYFGRGLVLSTGDFGNQGELPTHPELLDWLAAEFQNSETSGKWNVKKLQRMIVTSATYRQASHSQGRTTEADPDNRYYSRGPTYRISAEQVRDNSLVSSGLISRRLGGESVYPYQPAGIWEQISNYGRYRQQSGDTLYRRSMYTVWKRTAPPPMMLNFDASERHFCTVKRQKTSTPLQSLVVMNDPQFVEASRVLAQKMIHKSRTQKERIDYAFIALTGRPSDKTEASILADLYEDELKNFREHPEKARQLLKVGDFPVEKAIDPAELAATTMVATTIMNFDEFVIKR